MTDIYRNSIPGIWYTDFDENGNCTSAVYDESYRKLLGYESEDEYLNSNISWTDSIHPDDFERVFNEYNDCLKKHSDNKEFNLEYRMMTKWGYRWFHDYGHCVRREDGSVRHCYGVIFDINDTVEKFEANAQNNIRLFALEDNFESLYDVELDSGHYVSYDRGDFYKTNISSKLVSPVEFFDDMQTNIDRVVYEEDREATFRVQQRDEIRKELAENDHFDHYYRIITDQGLVWLKMRLVYKDAQKKNVIIGVFNAAEEMSVKQREAEEAKKLISSIAASYNIAYAVNMKDDSFKLIRMDENILGKGRKFNNFTEAKQFFINLLPDSDREMMSNELEFNTIKEKLKDKTSYTLEYRVPINNAIFWHEMNVTRIDEDSVALGFANKDLEITKKHLEDKRFSEYFALYEIDLDTGMLKIVKDSPWYEINRAGTAMPYTPAMHKFAESLDGEARDFFERLTDIEAIKKDLAEEDKRTYAYRSNNVGDKCWVDCTSYVTLRHKDGTPAMFTFGFSLVDSLGVYRQEFQSKYKDVLHIVNEEKQRNDILHDIIHSGKWSFIVSADDKVLKAEYSKEVMRVINNDFPSGTEDWIKIVHPEDKEETLKAFRATIADHTGNTQYDVAFRMADRNGVYHWFHSAGRIIRNPDGSGEFFGIHIDISSQIEEQLKQQRLLKDARIAAEAANQSKSNFLFNMSHDIRTPMNAIRGFTTMARKHLDDNEKVKDYLEKIDISGEQLLKLINQVLEMARIESGKIEFEENPLNVQKEFNSLITVVSEQAKASGLTFTHSFEKIRHYNVLGDAARISSVVMNLLGNSMKYTQEGGSIDLSVREIKARKPGYASYIFTVSDTGIGMSKEYLDKLYEPFSREKSSTVSKIQGTGLGLSIVKSIINLMGGHITVESELGKGTRFDITLDFKIDDKADTKKEEEVGTVSFEDRRVLLVEDNEMNREIAKDILEEQGLIIEDAEDGDVAAGIIQKLFERGECNYYDFILMDVQMPRMNGYDATKVIRELEKTKDIHIPIIAMTANAFEEDRKNALAAGMDDHLSKPIEVQKLFRTIAKFIN